MYLHEVKFSGDNDGSRGHTGDVVDLFAVRPFFGAVSSCVLCLIVSNLPCWPLNSAAPQECYTIMQCSSVVLFC